MFGGLIVILWGGYIVNRLGYYHAAVFMILLLVGAGVTLESILDHDPGDLAFLLLPMSFAVALLSRKLIFILGLSYLAAPVLMFFIVPENEGVTLLKFVIPLLAIGIVLNIISRIHRDRIEELREKQLYESEMRYLLSTEAVNDGVWDWDVKKNRVYYSARWKEMIGYQPHEIGDFPEEWFSRIHPDDREHVERHVKRFGRDESPFGVGISIPP
ncbi:MAG: PAS domain-containing protein [Chloroflexi bacterium]|nr:PAS domain-containing protein [Chloroflexota bacterium]